MSRLAKRGWSRASPERGGYFGGIIPEELKLPVTRRGFSSALKQCKPFKPLELRSASYIESTRSIARNSRR